MIFYLVDFPLHTFLYWYRLLICVFILFFFVRFLAKDCSFDTPDIVPITVGCALAALVIVVLIAYLVGRRRSQSRGYLSM